MRSLHLIAMAIAGLGLLGTVALMIILGARGPAAPPTPPPSTPDQGLEGMTFPQFALIDQNAAPQTHALLEGHYTIVSFIFTNCPLACPGMTGRLAELQDALAGTGVRFASFSLDPANDTPDALRAYSSNFGADPATWSFLTTQPENRAATWSIVTDALHFELRDDATVLVSLPGGATMPNIIHPTRFILVAPDRQILGFYTFSDAEQMAMLERRARELAKGE